MTIENVNGLEPMKDGFDTSRFPKKSLRACVPGCDPRKLWPAGRMPTTGWHAEIIIDADVPEKIVERLTQVIEDITHQRAKYPQSAALGVINDGCSYMLQEAQ